MRLCRDAGPVAGHIGVTPLELLMSNSPASNTQSALRRWRANLILAAVCVVAVALAVSACSDSSTGSSNTARGPTPVSTWSFSSVSSISAPATPDDTNGYPPGPPARRPPRHMRYALGPVRVGRRADPRAPELELPTAAI